jgi:hypothetical protein
MVIAFTYNKSESGESTSQVILKKPEWKIFASPQGSLNQRPGCPAKVASWLPPPELREGSHAPRAPTYLLAFQLPQAPNSCRFADVYLPSRRTCAKVAQKCVFKIERFTQIDCATAGNTG